MPGTALLIRPRAEVAPVRLRDDDVVDARLAPAHQAMLVELPQLVAVAAEPLAGRIVPLVLEANRDPVRPEAPQALAEHVVELTSPLLREERHDLLPPGDELAAVPPERVLRVRQADPLWVAGVPRIFGGLHLLDRSLRGERR